MKKKVDPRVRCLLESCLMHKERAFYVIVGDRGKDQIVNLYYLYTKLTNTKPSLLWCYKKQLAFSSHRRKRQKQLQQRLKKGLYDPNIEDPFELFICSADIKYIYYKQTQTILGKTFNICILQDYEALTPNVLCRTIETVKGGGFICLLFSSVSSLQQLHALASDIHNKYKTNLFQSVYCRYNKRFMLSLPSCRRCLILDDELNVLPFGGGPNLGPPTPDLLQQQQQQLLLLQQIQDKLQYAPPLDALIKLCATRDQAEALLAFLDCLCTSTSSYIKPQNDAPLRPSPKAPHKIPHKRDSQGGPQNGSGAAATTGEDEGEREELLPDEAPPQQNRTVMGAPKGASRQEGDPLKGGAPLEAFKRGGGGPKKYYTVALTAGRGRGKSAALGLAVAAAVYLEVSNIFICAPCPENVQTLFEFIQRVRRKSGFRV